MKSNGRIANKEALELYQASSLCELGMRADEVTRRLHPGKVRTYIVERNINYTNICRTRCSFCAFSVSPKRADRDGGYVLSVEQMSEKIEPLMALGGGQILLQGGMNPDLSFGWYEDMLRGLKERWPDLHIHAFSPPEILYFSDRFEMSIPQVIERLRDAGLDSIPGGGAEILVDRVRKMIAPAKYSSDQWLDVMRKAHLLGLSSTGTMMFGHVETLPERIEHMDRLRKLQDESLNRREKDDAAGVFTAFTCWPFQPGGSRLGKHDQYNPQGNNDRQPDELVLAGGHDQLKMTALSRLVLDNFDNIQASWVTQGAKIGQLSLLMGCNDIGSLMMEENVVAAAGTVHQMQLEQLKELIRQAGFQPVERDYYYRPK
ncbi:MAG: dehypoxanthine futalosine cyclase [Phycisphaerae bacterium]|nr:dehypoxanthine futalosine cyclase [Phycisphaerae bacterium]